MKKVLLINSDLANNRGDRAIAEGNIELIKQQFPGAQITGLSEQPIRDAKWYGINFANMSFQSLNPIDFIRLARLAHQNDIILWGGGEILKDYTNKAALWYWVTKISLLSHINPNIYGAYQGIGPTKSLHSKRLIVRVVNCCKAFIVRDSESAAKLIKWGVSPSKIHTASDPAILPLPCAMNAELTLSLQSNYDIDQEFLNDFICIGPRDWFHYTPGGIIPFKYKKKLYTLFSRSPPKTESSQHIRYIEQLGALIRQLSTDHPKQHILLIPMHMGEYDIKLCRKLRTHAVSPGEIRILDRDNLSPSQLRSVISHAKSMIGFRLHSTIIGTSAGVPSINLYYVDKGRAYFNQIEQNDFALPIECVLDDDFSATISSTMARLHQHHDSIKKDIITAVAGLRGSVRSVFSEVFIDE